MIAKSDLLKRTEVTAVVQVLCDLYRVAEPEVIFDLEEIWLSDGRTKIEGRYSIENRQIRFPEHQASYVLDSVCHEVAHHLDHERTLLGGGPHDGAHANLADELVSLARSHEDQWRCTNGI